MIETSASAVGFRARTLPFSPQDEAAPFPETALESAKALEPHQVPDDVDETRGVRHRVGEVFRRTAAREHLAPLAEPHGHQKSSACRFIMPDVPFAFKCSWVTPP